MQTLQFFDPGLYGAIYISLFWILLVVAKGCLSCWKTVKKNGWREARHDVVSTIIFRSLLLFLIGGAAVSLQWLVSSSQSYYAVSFDRNHVVLRFAWPLNDVVLSMAEVHSASFLDTWTGGARRLGKLTVESTRGTHETRWRRNRTALEEAAKQITMLKRESRERRGPFSQSEPTAMLPQPGKWSMFWRTLEWSVWGVGLATFIGSNLFLIRIAPAGGLGRFAGHTFITFSACSLVALVLTLFAPISKLHLFWFLPVAFGLGLYVASKISARRRGKDEAAHA